MIDAEVRKTIRGGRQMTGEELDTFLKAVRYGTLSYMNGEGWPDMRPLNFGFYNGCWYFHAHKTRGEKLKDLTSGRKVCISFYTTSDKVGLEHICQHDSVLVYGRLERLDGPDEDYDEMIQGLTAMCVSAGTAYKAAPERISKSIRGASVFKVIPEYTAGKVVKFASLPD